MPIAVIPAIAAAVTAGAAVHAATRKGPKLPGGITDEGEAAKRPKLSREERALLAEQSGLFREQANTSRYTRGVAQDLIGESTPLREALIGAMERRLGIPNTVGGADAKRAFRSRLNATERETYEAQFARAREGIISDSPRGGLLRQQLAGLQMDRARTIAGASTEARQQSLQQALGLGGAVGFGTPGVAFGGLGEAASGFANAASGIGGQAMGLANLRLGQSELALRGQLAAQQAEAQRGQATGQLLGLLGGMFGGGGKLGGGGAFQPSGFGFTVGA